MIGNSINELISIAERQSDERLAQELNPQTETGMLGPTWLPASELAFRQKIRAEAQAQPQNNPPVVQQLAQASAPPMMPQQMPQQMPPQMMAEGGLVGYANGGMINSSDDLLRATFPEYFDSFGRRITPEIYDPYNDDMIQRNIPTATGTKMVQEPESFNDPYFINDVNPDQQIVDDAINQLMVNQQNVADQPNIADQANVNAELAMGQRNLLKNREDEMLENRLTNMEKESEQYNQSSPTELEYEARQYFDARSDTLKDIGRGLGKVITAPIDLAKSAVSGYIDATTGLPIGVDLSEGKKEIQKDDVNEIKTLEEIKQQMGPPQPTPAELKELEKISKNADDNKQQVAVTGDGNPIVNTGSTISQAGGNKGVTDDAFLAEEQRLSKAKEEIFKGNMDRKWMAIAAGAFNAAQRGAPTLIQGLADLGGDVTGELQKLDKEDQDRAIALHEIYLQEATLAENRRKANLVYDAAMYGHNLDSLKNIADRIGKTSKEVLDATKAFDTAKKNKTLGDFGTEQYIGSVIDYADLGVVSAGLEYNQEIAKLRSKENEIKLDIEDFDPNNPEHVAEATKEFMEYLEDNPDKKALVSDFWKKDSLIKQGGTTSFDIGALLTLKPRM